MSLTGNTWQKRQALAREYKRLDKIRDKFKREVERRLPAPHPSIVYSPENDADGLVWKLTDCEPPKYIWPHYIEGRLSAVEYGSDADFVTAGTADVIDKMGGPAPLTGERAALYDRLEARLELSKEYEEERRRLKDEIGLNEVEDEQQRICDRRCKVDWHILSARPAKRSDISLKFAIYEEQHNDGDNYFPPPLLRDLRRLLDKPEVFAAVQS